MTASYRRGYMVRIRASGNLRAKGRMARTPITTSNTRIPRRRRARDLPYLRLLLWVAVGSALPQDHAPELVRPLAKSIQVSIILYHQVGTPGLLLTRELPCLHSQQRRLVQASLRSPRTAPLFRHRDGHREGEVPPPGPSRRAAVSPQRTPAPPRPRFACRSRCVPEDAVSLPGPAVTRRYRIPRGRGLCGRYRAVLLHLPRSVR